MKRISNLVLAFLVCFGLIGVISESARASVRSTALKTYTLKLTVKSGQGKTFLLVSKSGRTLDSAKVTSASKLVQLKTDGDNRVTSIAGATIQIVATNGGDYYGPVVLGWKKVTPSTTYTQASTVYTKLKASTALTLNLGTVTVTNARSNGKQGYAKPSTNSTLVDTAASAGVRATAGKPKGVGTYGKATTSSQEIGPFARNAKPFVGECGPAPLPPCEGGGGEIDPDTTLGGDKDDDGLPNAFDVNDDGDTKIDSADSTTPTPQAVVENASDGTPCSAVEFRIFTNFKATNTRFAGTINAYGTDTFQATQAKSAAAITRTMTMVFSNISNVCGSPVTKTEIKGVGVPYMPSEYAELLHACNTGDYQFAIGVGKVCAGDGMNETTLTGGYDFEAEGTLPSGQDTFQIRLTTADGEYELTSSPGFVFVTHPMVVSYGTSVGGRTNVDYTQTSGGPEGIGLADEPTISVAEGESLYLAIYRPQRLAIDGETGGAFYDLGGFRYTPDVPNYRNGDSGPSLGKCDGLTHIDGTDVSPASPDDHGLASDQPIDAETPRVLILEWDLSACLAARSFTWRPGTYDFDLQVEPLGPGGNSAQKIRVIFE